MLILFLMTVTGVVAVTQWRAFVREARVEAAHPPTGGFLEVDGVQVHYQIAGEGPDLVLLHGASGNLNDFTLDFTDRLTDRYRVIMFDRPGLGWTSRLPGHGGTWNTDEEAPHEQAALLIKAADKLGVQSPIVLGHSFGGIVTLAWGLTRPDEVAALVLVGGIAEPWPGKLGWTYRVIGSTPGNALVAPLATAFVSEDYVGSSIEGIFTPHDAPNRYADHIGAELVLRRHSLRANAQQVNALRPHVVEMKKQYHTLTMPIEMIHGDLDTIVPLDVHARVLMQDVPNGALKVLRGHGHMPQHTAPDEVEAAIDRAAARAGLR